MKLRAKFNLIFAVWIPILIAGLAFAMVLLRDLALGPELTRHTFVSFSVIVAAVLFAMFALGVLLLTDILRPIGILTHAVEEISEGKLDLDIPIDTSDEFGLLAKNVKSMAYTIQSRQRDLEIEKARLESEVYKRTADLCDINETLQHERDEVLRMTHLKDSLESRLRQSQKMSTVGTLAGGIAHDFNSILTSIISYADMALHTVDKEHEVYPMLDNLMKGTMRAQALVKQILLFSRQMKPEKKIFEYRTVLSEAVGLLRASTPKGIVLKQQVPDQDIKIYGDATQIFQIVMNLGTNAAKAMRDRDTGEIEFELSRVHLGETEIKFYDKMKPGDYARLVVTDNGSGMDRDTLERIFDPFFTTADVGGGTGLGLSVCHGIVEDHGGDISATSSFGKGSSFIVLLPINEKAPTASEGGDQIEFHERKCILLVDDEEDLAFLVKKMLERFGYAITVRTSPLEALEVYNARPESFDLIISDFKMPFMTGTQFAGEIRLLSKDVPIMLMTGFSENLDQEILDELNICLTVRKPIVAADLNSMIQKTLNIQPD